jgi:phosphohistidine phosphatase
MRIYLIRHSFAVDAYGSLGDGARYLSSLGRRVARAVGEHLKQRGHSFDAVLTSPLPRAVQTAELISERLDYLGEIEVLPSLGPDRMPRPVLDELRSRGAAIACVGHEPSISTLGALLVSRPAFPPMRPGSVALVEDGEPRFLLVGDTLEELPLRIE